MYETGAVDAGPVKCSEAALPETGFNRAGKGARIEGGVVEKERRRKYEVSRVDSFLYRSRYFTDAGIIGSTVKSCLRQGAFGSFQRASKEFVGEAPVKWKKFYGVNLRSGQAYVALQECAPIQGSGRNILGCIP